MPLTNSLAFHHLPDRDRDFGKVRLWGTVGWVAVGIGMGQWLRLQHTPDVSDQSVVAAAQFAGMADAFKLSGIIGILMGLFCFALPHTPPQKGQRKSATAEAMVEIRRQPLITLFLLAIPISCIHQFYFVHTAPFLGAFQRQAQGASDLSDSINRILGVGGGGLMTVGQISEIFVLGAIPLFAKKVARKWLLALGIVAYGVRMALFAYWEHLPIPGIATLLFALALHGPVFGLYIFLAFLIVDEETTGDVRASAQSLFNLVIVGIGVIVGSKLAAWWAAESKPPGGEMDYTKLFSAPMWASVACLVVLLIAYPLRSPRRGVVASGETA